MTRGGSPRVPQRCWKRPATWLVVGYRRILCTGARGTVAAFSLVGPSPENTGAGGLWRLVMGGPPPPAAPSRLVPVCCWLAPPAAIMGRLLRRLNRLLNPSSLRRIPALHHKAWQASPALFARLPRQIVAARRPWRERLKPCYRAAGGRNLLIAHWPGGFGLSLERAIGLCWSPDAARVEQVIPLLITRRRFQRRLRANHLWWRRHCCLPPSTKAIAVSAAQASATHRFIMPTPWRHITVPVAETASTGEVIPGLLLRRRLFVALVGHAG